MFFVMVSVFTSSWLDVGCATGMFFVCDNVFELVLAFECLFTLDEKVLFSAIFSGSFCIYTSDKNLSEVYNTKYNTV